jgi:RecG-like helicase
MVNRQSSQLLTPALDVGTSAVLAMLRAVEGGGQAALLVPTEILVNQHNNTIVNMCKGLTVTTPEVIT